MYGYNVCFDNFILLEIHFKFGVVSKFPNVKITFNKDVHQVQEQFKISVV